MKNTEPFIKIYCDNCDKETVRLNMANDDGTSSCRYTTCTCEAPEKIEPKPFDLHHQRETAHTIVIDTQGSIQKQLQESQRRRNRLSKRLTRWLMSKFSR